MKIFPLKQLNLNENCVTKIYFDFPQNKRGKTILLKDNNIISHCLLIKRIKRRNNNEDSVIIKYTICISMESFPVFLIVIN